MARDEHGTGSVVGIDATPEQIARCRQMHSSRVQAGVLEFREGWAHELPLADVSATKVMSVEAAQHFPELLPFFREAWRVLQPGGGFAVRPRWPLGAV